MLEADMPQPLRTVKGLSNPFKEDSPRIALLRYPNVAVHFATVIASWAQLELNLGAVLASLLGAEASVGVAMFNALSSTSAQKAAMLAAAETSLRGQDKVLFDTLMSMVEAVKTQRNTVAHGVWNSSDQTPLKDKLVVMPPKVALLLLHDVVTGHKRLEDLEETDADARARKLVDETQVYTANWFKSLAEEIERFSDYLARFAVSTQDARERQRLFDEPEIQAWVNRKKKDPNQKTAQQP